MLLQPNDSQDISTCDLLPTELSFNSAPESAEDRLKASAVLEVLDEEKINLARLRQLALSKGGFVNDALRRRGWPALLGLSAADITPAPSDAELQSHPEYAQVVLDVDRSLKRFPPGIPYEQRIALQDQLTRLILRVITKYPHLRYYQGYHDVAVTFLLVVGEDIAFLIMERLSTDHLKECMEPTMEKTSLLLNYVFPLIQRLHPELYDYIERSGAGTMFCLPWYLTWYGHSLNQYSAVVRLYDYFLASAPLLPLYLAAVIVAHRVEAVFSVDCDMASVHCLLSQLPDDLPFEVLLHRATQLYEDYPPESIEAEVKERANKELAERLREQRLGRQRRAAAAESRRRGRGYWVVFNRIIPGRPYSIALLVAGLAFGFYAYIQHTGVATLHLPSPNGYR